MFILTLGNCIAFGVIWFTQNLGICFARLVRRQKVQLMNGSFASRLLLTASWHGLFPDLEGLASRSGVIGIGIAMLVRYCHQMSLDDVQRFRGLSFDENM